MGAMCTTAEPVDARISGMRPLSADQLKARYEAAS